MEDLTEARGYSKQNAEALYRTLWRTRFGRGYGPVVRQTTERWSTVLSHSLPSASSMDAKRFHSSIANCFAMTSFGCTEYSLSKVTRRHLIHTLTSTVCHFLWVVGWVGYVDMINEPTGCDNWDLSDKITTLYNGKWFIHFHYLTTSFVTYI